MSIINNLKNDLKEAMRAKQQASVDAMRLITAAIKQVEVDERIIVDDERLAAILIKLAKMRNESIEQFKKAGRNDLVAQEEFELGIISKYFPKQLTMSEVDLVITQAFQELQPNSMRDLGKMMNFLRPKLQGRTDFAKVSELVKDKLN